MLIVEVGLTRLAVQAPPPWFELWPRPQGALAGQLVGREVDVVPGDAERHLVAVGTDVAERVHRDDLVTRPVVRHVDTVVPQPARRVCLRRHVVGDEMVVRCRVERRADVAGRHPVPAALDRLDAPRLRHSRRGGGREVQRGTGTGRRGHGRMHLGTGGSGVDELPAARVGPGVGDDTARRDGLTDEGKAHRVGGEPDGTGPGGGRSRRPGPRRHRRQQYRRGDGRYQPRCSHRVSSRAVPNRVPPLESRWVAGTSHSTRTPLVHRLRPDPLPPFRTSASGLPLCPRPDVQTGGHRGSEMQDHNGQCLRGFPDRPRRTGALVQASDRWIDAYLLTPRGCRGAEGFDPGTKVVGVGVVEVVENAQGLLPCLPGGLGTAGGVMGVAEVGEHVGLVVAVAEVAVEGSGRAGSTPRLPGRRRGGRQWVWEAQGQP